MDCIQTRDWLMQAEHVNRYAELPQEAAARLQAHLDNCDDCRTLQEKLLRLESRWRAIPVVPSAQEVERSREAFLRHLPKPADKDNRFILRGPWITRRAAARGIMAALLLLAVGLGFWMMAPSSSARTDDTLVERLLDWNLALARTQTGPERDGLVNRTGAFQAEIQEARLPAEDRELAQTLLENGARLAQHTNRIEQVKFLDGMADRFMDQIARAPDPAKAEKLTAQYRHISDQGIKPTVELLRSTGQLSAEERRQLDAVEARYNDRQKKIPDPHKPLRPGSRDRGEDSHRQQGEERRGK
jgi:hypothetical protein